jgi:hypothetical protein
MDGAFLVAAILLAHPKVTARQRDDFGNFGQWIGRCRHCCER